MNGATIPDTDQVARLCRPTDTASGRLMATAFLPKEYKDGSLERSLSVNWLEYLGLDSREAEIQAVKLVIERKLEVRANHRLAVLNVGIGKERVAGVGIAITVVHEPDYEKDDPSHSGIADFHQIPIDQHLKVATQLAFAVDEMHSPWANR